MSSEVKTGALMRYCGACGARLEKGSLQCPSCFVRNDESRFRGMPRTGAGGIGYSHSTDHESFAKYKKVFKNGGLIASPIITAVIVLILIICGVRLDLSLIVGLILIVPMILASLLSMRKKKSWEGTVERKKCFSYRGNHSRDYWKITFRTEDGKKKTEKWRIHPPLYDYLNEGDRVRYVGGIGGKNAFEKYDKSTDESIPCAGCGFLQDPRNTYCNACGCMLLKGNPTV